MARSIKILIPGDKIPHWKKRICATFQFWAPKDAPKEVLDEIMERNIAERKTTRQ